MNLRGKRILITAGPTWVPIDSVRIISNIATGETGILLAQYLSSQRRARVTLLLGTSEEDNLVSALRVIRFRFFNELKYILKRELSSKKYDIIIHSAAVSDFKLKYKLRGKLNSDKAYNLRIIPLEKLIINIRRLAKEARLVMFKLESAVTDKALIKRARVAGKLVGADLVVANQLNPYRAYIIDKDDNKIRAKSKKDLVKKLIKQLSVLN